MKIIKSRILSGIVMILLLLGCNNKEVHCVDKNELRAPAYPLVTIDPYTNAWSFGDNLYDSSLKHWTGQDFPLIGVVKVDGVPYRFMGIEDYDPMMSTNGDVPGLSTEGDSMSYFTQTARQLSVDVQPTRTIYQFVCGPVQLDLTFIAPLLMDDLELVARPVNYLSYEMKTDDGQMHNVELYIEVSPHWAMNLSNQSSVSETFTKDGFVFLKSGTKQQNILGTKGDDVRIDWGYFYLGTDRHNTLAAVGNRNTLRENFLKGNTDFYASAANTKGENQRMALVCSLGTIRKSEGRFLIGYDDIFSIQYFGENLRPYWNRKGTETILSQFHKANSDYEKLMKKCIAFDYQLMKEATEAGGRRYAELCALAYRQAISAHKLVEAPNGDLLFLSKENSSNGSIGTVDITYPSAPLFLLYNPELVKGMLNPIFYYSESGRWTKPFAAHDVGTYPLANGETYVGEMPIEESGNILILTASIAAVEGNTDYARRHWKTLTAWADYLLYNGLDPADQLCTDDFAGHLAHNANLSIKAILGVASYGYLAGKLGYKEQSESYIQKAKEMALEWVKMADDGDHYKLAFDKPGTWSQKYNLVWDKLMDWHIFPDKVRQTEIPYYLSVQNKYGLPLDNRETYTKTDWIMWTATLASDMETFEKFVDPVYLFMTTTPDRVPMTDWMYTDRPEVKVFRARSVVGGYYMKMLERR
jgi:glutaminase